MTNKNIWNLYCITTPLGERTGKGEAILFSKIVVPFIFRNHQTLIISISMKHYETTKYSTKSM